MTARVAPHASVSLNVVLPDTAQLGQFPAVSATNKPFTAPVEVRTTQDVLVLGPIGSRSAHLTAVFRQGPGKDETYLYSGCFGGTLDDFEEAVLTRKTGVLPLRLQACEYAAVVEMLRVLAVTRRQ